MSYEIKFADVGEGVHEGEVLELFVSEGEKVDVEQELLEVFTEKVTTEITSPVEGEIEQILFKVGDTIKVGQTLFLIKTESNNSNSEIVESLDLDDYKLNEIEEDPSLFKPSTPDSSITRRRSSPENVVVPSDSLSATNINKVLAPPAVRRRAREHNIDLSYVTGTGPAGRIKQIDLDHYINANDSNINGSKDQMLPSKSIDSPITNEEEKRVKLKGTRKTIAKYMRLSKDQAAHYTYFDEVDMTNLDSLRNQLRSKMEENDMESMLEKASLLQDRWYIVLRQTGDDNINMAADDTTTEDEDDEYFSAGTVILSGLVELMESDFDRVMAAGLARLNFEHEKQIIEESTGNGANVETFPGTNIVKIDFGKKQ